jgi:hypothetical protein
MQRPLDLCPGCGCNLDLGSIPPEWVSFYPFQKRWARKQSIVFKDPHDGELYEIWKCTECKYTWDSLENSDDKEDRKDD